MYELARRYSSRATWFGFGSATTKPTSSPTRWPRRRGSSGGDYKIAELERNVGQLVMEVDLL